MRLNNVLIVYMKENHGVLNKVKSALKKYDIQYKAVVREKIKSNDYNNRDLVIVVGGDGTFLKAALFIKDKTPILGVNSNVRKKEGFFMKSNKNNFDTNLKKILNNKHKTVKLTRLQAKINNKAINDLALNEFYIGCRRPYNVFRYWIDIDNKKELQKSSGVLVSTAVGSSAWSRSAGGKKIALGSRNFQYIVREPYHGTILNNYKLLKGVLKQDQKIKIIPEIEKCILVADSTSREYNLKKYDKVEISVSNKPLSFILK